MDINLNRREISTALILGLIFLLLGIGVFLLTWQNLSLQQEHVREHLEQSAKSIGRGIEANLHRRGRHGMSPGPRTEEGEAATEAEELLQDLLQEGEVMFFGMYGPEGRLLVSSQDILPVDFQPSQRMLESAAEEGWSGERTLRGRQVLIHGFPSRTREEARRDPSPRREDSARPHGPSREAGSIFIALDMSGHLEAYSGFQRTIIVQSGFTLAAIFIIGSLILGYLRRREQGQQFASLQNFHSTLLDNMPDGLISVNTNLEVTAANPAAERLLNSQGKLTGQDLGRYLRLSRVPRDNSRWEEMEMGDRRLEVLFLPISEEQQHLVLLRDRTQMKKLEQDLEQSRRLAAIGRFAAGVAHEIRNPLSSLKGFAQYFQQKMQKDESASRYARTMVEEADRLNRIIGDLLYLARPRALNPEQVDLEGLFSQIRQVLRSDLENKQVDLKTESGDLWIVADADLLKQALINLVLNSLQAVSSREGEITLKAGETEGGIQIEVLDNGHGMDEATLDQALEPFFSTREKGSGLGMAIVHRIVQDHGGKLDIGSQPDRGTRVSIFLPRNSTIER